MPPSSVRKGFRSGRVKAGVEGNLQRWGIGNTQPVASTAWQVPCSKFEATRQLQQSAPTVMPCLRHHKRGAVQWRQCRPHAGGKPTAGPALRYANHDRALPAHLLTTSPTAEEEAVVGRSLALR